MLAAIIVPVESGRLQVADGGIGAISAPMLIFGSEEAVISTARWTDVRDVVKGRKQDALDDVDHAIVLHGHVLLPELNVGILRSCIVQLGLPFADLLDFDIVAIAKGAEMSLPTEILNGHPPVGDMIREDAQEYLTEDGLIVTCQVGENIDVVFEDIIGVGWVATALVPQIVRCRPTKGLVVGREEGEILVESIDLVLDAGRIDQLQKNAESLVRTGRIGQILEELVGGEIFVLAIDPTLIEAR